MRVVIDGEFFAYYHDGGVARYFAELARGLHHDGIDARVFAPLHSSLILRDSDATVDGFYVPKSRRSKRLRRWLYTRTAPIILQQSRFDLLHETWYENTWTKARRPVVTTVHDMIHELFEPHSEICALKRDAVQRADFVICVSHNTRNDLLDRTKIDPGKVGVIHHGHKDFGPSLGDRTDRSPIERPFFLYVGRRKGYKNFQAMLAAYASDRALRRDTSILCFGGGPFKLSEIEQFRQYGLTEQQIVQTDGADEKLATAYRSAIALVYPSQYEGFGFPPLEAMSASCPVVCSASSCLPEIVGDAAILFTSNDHDELLAAMKRVMDPDVRADLVARGHIRRALFSWRQSCAAHAETYRSLVGTPTQHGL